MVNIMKKNEILVKYKNGDSQRLIAKELGISRNTVKKYIDEFNKLNQEIKRETDKSKIAIVQKKICEAPKSKKRTKKKSIFTSNVERRFKELIDIDEQRNKLLGRNKQQITASLIHKTLVNEGFNVGQTTITNAYRLYKEKQKECYIRQHYEYGERVEFDFHHIAVLINGKVKKIPLATFSLPKSNYAFAMLCKNETKQTVMDCIVRFINHCNGVFDEIVFDNMSAVVKRLLIAGNKEYTEDMIKISTYYGFKINTCNPYSGNEKGHVENSGKLIRRNFFSLKFDFDSEESLYQYFNEELIKFNASKLDEFEQEKKALKPKPLHDYIICKFQTNKVNSYSLISIEHNYYSVPDKYVGKDVTSNIFPDMIHVYYKDLKIAEHIKKEGLKEYSIDILHYLATFIKKPGALKNSLALKQAPDNLKSLFYENYNMNAKEFLRYLHGKENNLIEKNHFEDSIKDISVNQLKNISQLFNVN